MANTADDDKDDALYLKGLSEEELAALEDDDSDDDAASLESLLDGDDADGDDDDDDDDDSTDGDDDAAPAPAGKSEQPVGKTADADSTDDSIADNGSPEFRTTYQVDPVENFDQKMADFEAQKKALRASFTDGTIDIDAYEEQKDAVIAEQQAIREQNLKYTIAVEQNEQNNIARWQWEQDRFFEADANAIYKNKLVMSSLDTAVKDLAGAPENANKSAVWFLKEGDRQVREALGIGKAADKVGKAAVTNRKPDLSKVPPNLGALPAAENSETGTSEFNYLENLDGMKLEQALSKLTLEQQARYLEVVA